MWGIKFLNGGNKEYLNTLQGNNGVSKCVPLFIYGEVFVAGKIIYHPQKGLYLL